jgi:hypothetical protein
MRFSHRNQRLFTQGFGFGDSWQGMFHEQESPNGFCSGILVHEFDFGQSLRSKFALACELSQLRR